MIAFRGVISLTGSHENTRCAVCGVRLEGGDPYVVHTVYEGGYVTPTAWFHPGCEPK